MADSLAHFLTELEPALIDWLDEVALLKGVPPCEPEGMREYWLVSKAYALGVPNSERLPEAAALLDDAGDVDWILISPR